MTAKMMMMRMRMRITMMKMMMTVMTMIMMMTMMGGGRRATERGPNTTGWLGKESRCYYYLVAFGPSRHRAWIRGHWTLLEAMVPSWSGGEPKARESQILDHSRH
eukprot:828-Pyramimonas_sp.AAC.1